MSVVIVGAGHAGLALSRELTRAGVEHVILERAQIGQSWRTRWDSFCLVTPNWTVQLPGRPYDGDDADGFMPRDEIVTYLEDYAERIQAPVRLGIDVSSVESASDGRFLLRTSDGDIETESVVLASGAYQRPHRPRGAGSLPEHIYAIDSEAYTSPGDLPPGKVLVVGSGQTGCQVAEELNESGRDVTLACGRAPWAPRRIEGRDIVSWINQTPFFEQKPSDLPSPAARLGANVQASGRDGGHDLHYRTLAKKGVSLAGRFVEVEEDTVVFADDLAASVAFGDARYADIGNLIRKSCLEQGETPPEIPPAEPFDYEGRDRMDLDGCGAVIFTSGFRPDFTSWVHFTNAFDEFGFPIQTDGASTVVPGLYFMGMHFLRQRKSATFLGAGVDAPVVAAEIAAH